LLTASFEQNVRRLTPNDFATLAALRHYLLALQLRYQAMAHPFRWAFTRADLHRLLANLSAVWPAA
jgi:hypothetical protein